MQTANGQTRGERLSAICNVDSSYENLLIIQLHNEYVIEDSPKSPLGRSCGGDHQLSELSLISLVFLSAQFWLALRLLLPRALIFSSLSAPASSHQKLHYAWEECGRQSASSIFNSKRPDLLRLECLSEESMPSASQRGL